jgi:hypothetical protein
MFSKVASQQREGPLANPQKQRLPISTRVVIFPSLSRFIGGKAAGELS